MAPDGRTKFRGWLAGAASLTVCFNGAALAQSTASAPLQEGSVPASANPGGAALESSAGIGDIIVTARRRDERLQDVPISVAAIGGEQLEARGVLGLADLQNAVSGIKIEAQNNRTTTPQVTIRGQRQYGVLEAQDPPTAFYFAEAPVAPIQGFNSALYDLSSIQVLKGPQGTLFGRNTTGGAVLVTPAKPTDEFKGSLTGTVGNYNTFGLQGFINVPLTPTLYARVSGYFRRHGGYATYVSTQLFGQKAFAERTGDVRGSIVWKPSDRFENYLVASFSDLHSTANPAVIVAFNPVSAIAAFDGTGVRASFPTIASQVYVPGGTRGPRDVLSDFPQFDNVKTQSVVNTSTFTLNDNLTLKNIASYRHMSASSKFNVFGTSLPGISSRTVANAKNYSEELQMNGTFFDSRLTVTAGLFYSKLRAYDDGMTAALYIAPPIAPSAVNSFIIDATNISKAAYAQATLKITDKLSFTAGGRVTKDIRKVNFLSRNQNRLPYIPVLPTPYCYLLNDAGVRLAPDACSIKKSTSFSEPTYTLSLDYHITPDIMIYATRRTGYRSGGFNQRAFSALQRVPFKPEKELDHEIGFKSKFTVGDWRVRLNADYYYDRYTDLQKSVLSLVNGVVASSIFNAAKGHVQGIEADIDIAPSRRFNLGANLAYTDTGYSSYPFLLTGVSNGLNNTVQDFSDRKFAGIPKWQYSIYGSYELPLDAGMGKVILAADFSHQDGQFVSDVYQSKEQISIRYTAAQAALLPDSSRPYRTRGFNLVNGRVTWANIMGSSFTAAIFARNIFNVAPEVATNPSYESTGVTAVSFGPPRTVGLELKVDF